MKKLIEVEEATALMLEARDWSVMHWLREKKRVRKTADKANNALWALQKEIKTQWPEDLRAAYNALQEDPNGRARQKPDTSKIDPEIKLLAKQVKDADDEANRAHEDAEATFDKAERILSTSMAREGTHVTIKSWELYEKAITKAESGIRSTHAAK
jgi:uncharacterized protein YoxC